MRIELVTEGGFAALPGLQKPVVLDCALLPADVAVDVTAQCNELVRELAAAPPAAATPTALRDARRYTVTVEADGRTSSFTASDTAMSAAFRHLLDLVRSHGRR
ncbi:protealysin inhibitor emfourin [Pseudoduganella plicata]|uniref:Uncharacterized protein n=1 Tax=Pseudoduganella plicata TaxID=321984 RepID=A0A4P7BEH3_9BURK|nr:protealysin inhibitor emfourin [Pseudoduganella plicata]QBQ35719.1 hypothetical protein E1742_05735 [Pseudoduganella plicata]GGY95685.1 hypothetical protein GCM10007388_31340 [Pseudoduganella plicata]